MGDDPVWQRPGLFKLASKLSVSSPCFNQFFALFTESDTSPAPNSCWKNLSEINGRVAFSVSSAHFRPFLLASLPKISSAAPASVMTE